MCDRRQAAWELPAPAEDLRTATCHADSQLVESTTLPFIFDPRAISLLAILPRHQHTHEQEQDIYCSRAYLIPPTSNLHIRTNGMTSTPPGAATATAPNVDELCDLVSHDLQIESSTQTLRLSTPAAAAVLHTTELCEMILQSLSFDELSRIRHVNHFLRNVIEGSRTLRQKLFLLPTGPGDHASDERNLLLAPILKRCGFPLWSCGFPLWSFDEHSFFPQGHLVVHMPKEPLPWPGKLPEYLANMLVSKRSCRSGIWMWYLRRQDIPDELLPGPDVKLRDVWKVLEKRRKKMDGLWYRGHST